MGSSLADLDRVVGRTALPPVEVCLVQMPYASVERPSIALGTLHALLERAGPTSTVVYPNVWFAEFIGLDAYAALVKTAGHTLLGEWTFAGAAFPDFAPDHAAFHALNASELAVVAGNLLLQRDGSRQAVVDALWQVRRAAQAFIDRVAQHVLTARPRIVGCSSTFQQHCASLALLRRVRELDPGVVTLLGGGNCEGSMGRATHRGFPWVDYVVSGEADGFFLELCRAMLERGRDLPASALPEGVYGPCHRRVPQPDAARCGEPAPRALVRDLDALPVPRYEHYFEALKRSTIAPYVDPGLLVETARGCWWGEKSHCTFCGLNGTGIAYRSKSPARAVREIGELAARYGLERLEAVDNIVDTRYFETVFTSAELAGGRYSLFYETKANLARRQLRTLAAAGVSWIQPGIESLHPQMVRLFRKGNTVWASLQLLKWALELGLRVEWLFLFGAPGEADEWYGEMARWLPAVSHLQAPSGLARVEYDRFSPYHDRPSEFGITLTHYKTYDYVYPLPVADLGQLAYFFEDYGDTQRGSTDPRRFPGLAAWCDEAARWRLEWLKPEVGRAQRPPQLRRRERPAGGLTLFDTRSCASAAEFDLDPLSSAVLLACDEALTRERLVRSLAGRLGAQQVERACDQLVERRLLLDVQGRLLDLTLPEDTPPLPRRYPGGSVHLSRYLRDKLLARHAATGGLAPGLGPLPHAAASRPGGARG